MRHLLAGFLCALAIAVSFHAAGAQSSDAYRLLGATIRVDQELHWRNWILQNDMVTSLNVRAGDAEIFAIGSEGVKPRFFRRAINAAPEALSRFYPDRVRGQGKEISGGVAAHSNQRLANAVIDDDLSTYWEPATPATYQDRLRDPMDFTIDKLRNWQLEVDLGQVVVVDSIAVIFPSGRSSGDEFLGDPLKNFALLVSMGERYPFPDGINLKYTGLLEVATNEGEYRPAVVPYDAEGRYLKATFRPEPLDLADFDLDGRKDMIGGFVQYVQLKITGSDLWRDARLGADEEGLALYEALPPEARGALVYQRQTAGGVFVELEDEPGNTAENKYYNELPEEKRGPIVYFRKEAPRVAEIQVWTKGDNIALRPERNAGAAYENGGLGTPFMATDGVFDTEWIANTWSPLYEKGLSWWDLGAVFWVDSVWMVNKRTSAGYVQGGFMGYDVRVSDGTLLKPVSMEQPDDFPQLEEGLKWDNIVSEAHVDNRTSRARVMREEFPLRKVRFFQVRDIDVSGAASGRYGAQANLGEIQFYGEGYPVSVWVYSPPIALTDARGNFIRKTLPKISWEGEAIVRQTDPVTGRAIEVVEPLDAHPQVDLQVQTRTSDQTDTNYTYFEVVSITGAETRTEISKEAYDDLVFKWDVWNKWLSLPKPHESNVDDDGDGLIDEDEIDFVDNDGDGRIDEDGKKLRESSKRPKSTPDKKGELAFVGWSEWSASYAPTEGRNEAVITSPNPRKFLQLRVNILSNDLYKTGRIRSLAVELAPPLSLELVGELALLTRERPLGDLSAEPDDYELPRNIDPLQPQKFSYFIRAAGPDPADPAVREGFDEVLIVTQQAADLLGVRLGQVTVTSESSPLDSTATLTRALESRFSRFFQRSDEDGLFWDEAGNLLEVLPAGADSLYLRLPFSANAGLGNTNHGLVEVQFASQALQEGKPFTSFVRDSRNPDAVFQRVEIDEKDATELVESSTVRPSLLPLGGDLVQGLEISPVITPNGDGVNDRLWVRFTLLKLQEERSLDVDFLDLHGRLVGRAQRPNGGLAGGSKVGNLEFAWDGRDLSGELVPPGIYLCRIKVEADKSDNVLVRAVHVAY